MHFPWHFLEVLIHHFIIIDFGHLHFDLEISIKYLVLFVLYDLLRHLPVDQKYAITIDKRCVKPKMENALILALSVVEFYFDVIVDEHLVLRMELQMRCIIAVIALVLPRLLLIKRIIRVELLFLDFFFVIVSKNRVEIRVRIVLHGVPLPRGHVILRIVEQSVLAIDLI